MKEVLQSKTVWFNVIMTVITMAEFMGNIKPEWLGVTVMISGLGNIILRIWFTSQPILAK